MSDSEILQVVKAHIQGKKIECRRKRETDWYHLAGDPVWNFDDYDFRVAPELRKPREWNVIVNEEGNINWGFKYDHRFMGGVRVREVLEDE